MVTPGPMTIPEEIRRVYGIQLPPLCPKHGVPMKRYCTRGELRYFRCPRKTCACTAKQTR